MAAQAPFGCAAESPRPLPPRGWDIFWVPGFPKKCPWVGLPPHPPPFPQSGFCVRETSNTPVEHRQCQSRTAHTHREPSALRLQPPAVSCEDKPHAPLRCGTASIPYHWARARSAMQCGLTTPAAQAKHPEPQACSHILPPVCIPNPLLSACCAGGPSGKGHRMAMGFQCAAVLKHFVRVYHTSLTDIGPWSATGCGGQDPGLLARCCGSGHGPEHTVGAPNLFSCVTAYPKVRPLCLPNPSPNPVHLPPNHVAPNN